MSQAIRQSELFAGEDWKTIYKAFTQANYNAYDFTTIRDSMVGYLRFNYPEDFNDWIESSEFVALIDLLAYLGQSLAFRTDFNARENFIDTAERRESILRMARLLSYTASRNIPARGVAKISSLRTTEEIYDSLGQSLQNVRIDWNDANNPDWYEQWTLILNSTLKLENQFGQPVKAETIGGIPTQLYQMNSRPTSMGQYNFSATVEGNSLPFEVVNVDIEAGSTFFERAPDPLYAMHLLYRNDGNGNSSADTGFFVYFKQGSLGFEDFTIESPIENRVIDLSATNVNQFDVWVNTINDAGLSIKDWTKVPALVGSNIVYNALNKNIVDIFSVITGERDKVSIRFADGVFGTVPTGTIRAYYRTSANSFFTVQPKDIQQVTITIPYFNSRDVVHNLTITFDLQRPIGNSAPSETIEQIRRRAPQVYYTQNRMVNGEDYNIYPLQDSTLLKTKAINRVYSGHSRFIDINDPTSTYQDTNVLANDGSVYREFNNQYQEISHSEGNSPSVIIDMMVSSFMKHIELTQFFYALYPKQIIPESTPKILWQQSTSSLYSSTGQFTQVSSSITPDMIKDNLGNNNSPFGSTILVGVDTPATDPEDFITVGSLIKFRFAGWVSVDNVVENGNGFYSTGKGKVTLSENVLTNDQILEIYSPFRTNLTTAENSDVFYQIDNKNTFGLRYSVTDKAWKIIDAANLANINLDFSFDHAGDLTLSNLDASWLIRFDYTSDAWKITGRGLRYVWESEKDVRFFVNQFYKVVGNVISKASKDTIKVYSTYPKPNDVSVGLGEDLTFAINDIFVYEDGYQEPKKVIVGFNDKDRDGIPDDPTIFERLVMQDVPTADEWKLYIFHSSTVDNYGYRYKVIDNSIVGMKEFSSTALQELDPTKKNTIISGTVVWNFSDKLFYTYTGTESDTDRANPSKYTQVTNQQDYDYTLGRTNIIFLWNHVATATHRIDPAISNIIDIFALTQSYDAAYRIWATSADLTLQEPQAPTTEDLKLAYSYLESNKMVSDQIIWRPVKYKPLFGKRAAEEYRAKFKVVKVEGSSTSDGEIKSKVISAINRFFGISNWNFGDTFFASELQAYIHSTLPTIIGGVEIIPINNEARFGNLQQIKCESDEIFISTASVNDIEIVKSFTETVLRMGN
jgi:hypothetical protein